MTHSSSQSTSVLCRAIKKNPIQTELKKKPPPCLTSRQIRQVLGFLTRAQTSIIRKYQLLNQLFDHAGFFISVERKDSGHFQVSWCVSVRSRTSCLLCISVSLCLLQVTKTSIASRLFAMLTKDDHCRDTERKRILCSCQQP